MRPQFGSAPCSAVFTSGELATARAQRSTTSPPPPRTTTRPIRRAPSPSRTIRIASIRSSASSASPRRSSSSLSGATATPLAPEQIRITVSFVDSWPSTEMRSNERLTQTPSSSSAVSGASAASVCTKQSIVANAGSIIPAPLHWPLSRTRAGRQLHLERRALGERVGRHDRLAEGRVGAGIQRRGGRRDARLETVRRQLHADHAGRRDGDAARARRRAPRRSCAASCARRRSPARRSRRSRCRSSRSRRTGRWRSSRRA